MRIVKQTENRLEVPETHSNEKRSRLGGRYLRGTEGNNVRLFLFKILINGLEGGLTMVAHCGMVLILGEVMLSKALVLITFDLANFG